MKLLAIESSALVASAAIIEDGLLKGEFTVNNKLTHSETLLPMVRELFRISGMQLSEMNAIAVSAGPGSFTGLRIGAATAKGLALAADLPIVQVHTLKAMADELCAVSDRIVCPIMDARRGQVYSAAFCEEDTVVNEGARDIHEFLSMLDAAAADGQRGDGKLLFLGDGVPVHEALLREHFCERAVLVPAQANRQRAAGIAAAGEKLYRAWLEKNGLSAEEAMEKGADAIDCFDADVMNSDRFVPDYMRKPQAEREMAAGLLEDPGKHSLKKVARGDR